MSLYCGPYNTVIINRVHKVARDRDQHYEYDL